MIIICDEVNGYDDNDEGLILTSKNSMILPICGHNLYDDGDDNDDDDGDDDDDYNDNLHQRTPLYCQRGRNLYRPNWRGRCSPHNTLHTFNSLGHMTYKFESYNIFICLGNMIYMFRP